MPLPFAHALSLKLPLAAPLRVKVTQAGEYNFAASGKTVDRIVIEPADNKDPDRQSSTGGPSGYFWLDPGEHQVSLQDIDRKNATGETDLKVAQLPPPPLAGEIIVGKPFIFDFTKLPKLAADDPRMMIARATLKGAAKGRHILDVALKNRSNDLVSLSVRPKKGGDESGEVVVAGLNTKGSDSYNSGFEAGTDIVVQVTMGEPPPVVEVTIHR
ncbi:MAG: hypothetical protein NVSMB1_02500 [Polyangiales bacterium]